MDRPRPVNVDAFRRTLYSPNELLGGFQADAALSYLDTYDFRVYREWVRGGREHADHLNAVAHAIHDASITEALDEFVATRRVVGIMGGHRMTRAHESGTPYRRVVELARNLSSDGYTVATGGGPGAMEAAHLGALTSALPLVEVEGHLRHLAEASPFPHGLGGLVSDVDVVDEALVGELHAWQAPAFEIADKTPEPVHSLGVPTWHYGHEPPTPLATHIAKYFQNSIREDGLLAIAKFGVIFFEGSAGTIQEIFADATQNFYGRFRTVSPMVFVGTETWTRRYPVWDVLVELFDDHGMLHLTDSVKDAARFIATHPPGEWVA